MNKAALKFSLIFMNIISFFSPLYPQTIHNIKYGGEQQMLPVARELIPDPKTLLLDEPSLELASNLIKDLFDKLVELKKSLELQFYSSSKK